MTDRSSRREFLRTTLNGVSLLVTVQLVSACGGGSDKPSGPDAPAGCTSSDPKCTIADNHVHSPHMIMVVMAEVQAAADKSYDIMGAATHTHQVAVTAADFQTLQSGGTLMITSTEGLLTGATTPHTHLITISCA